MVIASPGSWASRTRKAAPARAARPEPTKWTRRPSVPAGLGARAYASKLPLDRYMSCVPSPGSVPDVPASPSTVSPASAFGPGVFPPFSTAPTRPRSVRRVEHTVPVGVAAGLSAVPARCGDGVRRARCRRPGRRRRPPGSRGVFPPFSTAPTRPRSVRRVEHTVPVGVAAGLSAVPARCGDGVRRARCRRPGRRRRPPGSRGRRPGPRRSRWRSGWRSRRVRG